MDIASRIKYVQQHIAALATDIDTPQGECQSALQFIASAATAAANTISETRDKCIAARREAAAKKQAAIDARNAA
jgi:hypothetical protein